MVFDNKTIVALSTPPGKGAIAIIRISGPNALQSAKKNIQSKSNFDTPNHIVLGNFYYQNKIIDQVMVAYFQSPNSYTGEDMIEIYCHGSVYIQQRIIQCLIDDGLELAKAGEFSLRAFLNKKMDLAQSEAVCDLIESESKASHQLAINQLKGTFSTSLSKLREQLIEFKSLIELELDFSEQDLEFANREKLRDLVHNIEHEIKLLRDSFAYGNAIKKGIDVTILGRPNVGKSSLLNVLLKEPKAIVSDIPGTTRDSIEDLMTYKGYQFRFIDTAGIRQTSDEIETLGIKIALKKAQKAQFCLYLYDSLEVSTEDIIYDLKKIIQSQTQVLLLESKIDRFLHSNQKLTDQRKINSLDLNDQLKEFIHLETSIYIPSTIKKITDKLIELVEKKKTTSSVVVSNLRHYQCLTFALDSLKEVDCALKNNLSGDLLSVDLNLVIHHIGQITGHIDIDDDIIGTIFGKFCIGK